MALKHFGKPENDEGTWFEFDSPTGAFELRVRRLSPGVSEKIDARHKGKAHFEVIEGIRRPIRDLEAITDGLAEKAAWCLTDARGLKIAPADAEGLAFWKNATKVEDLEVGAEIEIAGEVLSHEIKMLLIRELRPFCTMPDPKDPTKVDEVEIGMFIIRKAGELQKGHAKGQDDQAGNS